MQKKLKPAEREKKRYILIQSTKAKTKKAILNYLGVLGYAKSAPVFVNKAGKLILAINRKQLESVKVALALAKIPVKKISGTIKGLT